MLSDPIAVTYNGSAKSLPRTSMAEAVVVQRPVSVTRYKTAEGDFEVSISRFALENKHQKVEILLTRVLQDSDSDPFNGSPSSNIQNSFGMSYVVNNLRYNTSTEIPLLRAALNAFVDTTLQGRLVGGES